MKTMSGVWTSFFQEGSNLRYIDLKEQVVGERIADVEPNLFFNY